MTISSDVQVDEGIVLDARLEASVQRMAAALKEGEFGRINATMRDIYVHALPGGVYRVSGERGAPPAVRDFGWAAPLWERLLNGADSPSARAELAWSMVRLVPCGPCKTNWATALRGLTDEHLATAEAFRRWVWEERQRIAESKGKERWPYPD